MMHEPGLDNMQRAAIDAVAAAISPAPHQLSAERAEHVLLFNLLGDPLLRIRYPQPIELQTVKAALPGEAIEVSGRTPVAGRCTVELTVPRGTLTFTPPAREIFPGGPGTGRLPGRLPPGQRRAADGHRNPGRRGPLQGPAHRAAAGPRHLSTAGVRGRPR